MNQQVKSIVSTAVTMTPLQSGETDVDSWSGFAISIVEEAVFSEGPVLPCDSEFPVFPEVPSAAELSVSFVSVLARQIRAFEDILFTPLN